ncbi:uncharacterized protein LAESUDRAFT_753872 [Laetiporus sulphureus 93-53]|uniref:Uncharacterized protein n=1 Tax=Laetiporus sulphureus 93-53 TaxID=1314785 RepID=A0A165IB82_9APHY|nr:uncharacterized protein LAESUDRAFT_753872 [Laetiporus sulphureus 93-53]KZT12837.1 hypothetical protein LAESUDRAFT_753872 [Laetiporus sulphureus 93-53]
MARLVDVIINEALHVHSTSGIDLLHVAPKGNKEVWSEDVEIFRLERWGGCILVVHDDLRLKLCLQRTYVGRNLASLELLVIVSSILRQYHFMLEEPEKKTWQGFLCKPVQCKLSMKRRTV